MPSIPLQGNLGTRPGLVRAAATGCLHGVGIGAKNGFNPLSLRPAVWFSDTGGNPGVWEDLSGNGKNLIQSNQSLQPAIIQSSLNGRQIRRFDGSGTIMATEKTVDLTKGASVFFVSKNRVRKDCNGICRISQSAVVNSIFEIYWQNGVNDSGSGNVVSAFRRESSNPFGAIITEGGSPAIGNNYIGSTITNGATCNQFANGKLRPVTQIIGGVSTIPRPDLLWLGIGYQTGGVLDGDIAEFIAFPSALEESNRKKVESYLSQKWGIPLA